MQMFHVKHSELPPHGGDVRDASTSSAHRRDSTVGDHASTPPLRDEPSGDPINQRDDGSIDQHKDSREGVVVGNRGLKKRYSFTNME